MTFRRKTVDIHNSEALGKFGEFDELYLHRSPKS
jgi:hypothetical protein